MRYQDAIYGPVEITEPVLLELMDSRAMARLRGVLQHGVTALLGITAPFSRYDHSVGVMLLVRRLGGSLEEQVAALLHDVSHTAFSHVIDHVFDSQGGESYHEAMKEEHVADSDIPAILQRHGRDWRDYLDESRFSLLEQAAPALCADRVDYFLRDLEFLGLADAAHVPSVVAGLTVHDGRLVAADTDMARWLAYTYIEADRLSWSSFREVGLYQLTAEAIKTGLAAGVIGTPDLWGADRELWRKLQTADHAEVRELTALVSPATRFTWDEDDPWFRVATKVRSIDPPVLRAGEAVLLSHIDRAFGRYREEYHAGKRGAWPMGVVAAGGTGGDSPLRFASGTA